jgi:WD40 repeat protein
LASPLQNPSTASDLISFLKALPDCRMRRGIRFPDHIRHSIGLNNNEQLLVSGSLDKTIKMWNFSTGGCLKTIETPSGIWSLAVIEGKKTTSKFFSNKFVILLFWILETLKNIFNGT